MSGFFLLAKKSHRKTGWGDGGSEMFMFYNIHKRVYLFLCMYQASRKIKVKTRRKRLGMIVHVYILGYLGTEAGRL
jgi:hypothetical protein